MELSRKGRRREKFYGSFKGKFNEKEALEKVILHSNGQGLG